MKKAILAKLDNKRILSKWFIPSWNGFTGDVVNLGDNKWDIRGTLSVSGRKAHITELPIGCSLTEYFAVLKKLKEKGIITKFVDNSEMDRFDFEVTLSEEESQKSFEEIFNDLKLSVIITENLTCIDENNAIIEFETPEELFNKYFDIKKEYLNKRLQSEISRLEKEALSLEEVHKFIEEVIKGTLNLKKKKAELEKDMVAKGYTNIDKLLALPLSSLTTEKALEIKKRWEDKVTELEEMRKKDFKTLWEEDLKWL
jgi:DNA topoisomerase-2